MPELPEVETIRLGLQKFLVGHKLIGIEVNLKKQFIGDPKNLIGSKIIDVRRFGKGLVVDLNNLQSIAIHIKMTGQLIYRRGLSTANLPQLQKASKNSEMIVENLPDKYTHVIFHLDDNSFLFYRDIRQFGWIKIVESSKLKMQSFFNNLGPEPLKDLTLNKFSEILKSSRTPIKLLLMDQSKIAGIGNIYANDALFEAKIHPKMAAQTLTDNEKKALFYAIEKVLKKGLESGGASEWNYVNALGEKGGYQNFFKVYNREGKACSWCGSIIERIKMGGRGTFYCPICQK